LGFDILVDGGGSNGCALLGDNIADMAYRNHWNGMIVFGYIRDSVAVSAIDIGIIALGTNPKKSAKDNLGTVNLTVRFADVDFVPGEFVYVDEDGMVVSSTELALP